MRPAPTLELTNTINAIAPKDNSFGPCSLDRVNTASMRHQEVVSRPVSKRTRSLQRDLPLRQHPNRQVLTPPQTHLAQGGHDTVNRTIATRHEGIRAQVFKWA